MKLFFITNSIGLASFALEQGVDRIFVDLEINGKVLRQGHLDTLISRHEMADVALLRSVTPPGALLVRLNPLHAGSAAEVDQAVAAGADILMLPMFRTPAEVDAFARLVAGRARVSLLVETVDAMRSLRECVAVPGVDEVHIGLNDLHLELKQAFMFEPLADGLVDAMAAILREAGLPFGIGGIARAGEGLLPAELLLSEHVRLGSSAAILSRTFHRQAANVEEIRAHMEFDLELARLRAAYAAHLRASPAALEQQRQLVKARIGQIAASLRARAAAERPSYA